MCFLPNDDAIAISEDGPGVTVDVLANDTDVDATDTLTVDSVSAGGGLVTNNGTDVFYDPNGQFEYLAQGEVVTDTFTYTVDDGNGGQDTATVTVTITGQNDGPTAVDDVETVLENGTVTGNVLPNDTDPDADDVLGIKSMDTTGTIGQGSITVGDGDHIIKTGELGTGMNDVAITVGDGNSCIEFTDQIQMVNTPRRVDPDINAGDGDHKIIGNIGQNSNGTQLSVGSVVTVELGDGDSEITMNNIGGFEDNTIRVIEDGRWVTRERTTSSSVVAPL